VGNLRDLQAKAPRPQHKAFKAYEPGYLHVDVKYLPQMADETSRRYLFVAIDRATRWVFIRVYKSKTSANKASISLCETASLPSSSAWGAAAFSGVSASSAAAVGEPSSCSSPSAGSLTLAPSWPGRSIESPRRCC
jgi:hypothetical protein